MIADERMPKCSNAIKPCVAVWTEDRVDRRFSKVSIRKQQFGSCKYTKRVKSPALQMSQILATEVKSCLLS